VLIKQLFAFKPFWIRKVSDKYLPIWTLLYISFKHILISLTNWNPSVFYRTRPSLEHAQYGWKCNQSYVYKKDLQMLRDLNLL
jgi:hypothetical protein